LGSPARGEAIFQPAISLNCGDTIAAGSSKFGPTGAHPASAKAASAAAPSGRLRTAAEEETD